MIVTKKKKTEFFHYKASDQHLAVNRSERIFLKNLELYGILFIALNWFGRCLIYGKQIVKYKSVKLESLEIKCGVPQGSAFGPILFLSCIKDIY